MASVWDGFRVNLYTPTTNETMWQYMDAHHRVNLATKSVTFNLNVVFKAGPTPFLPGSPQGTFTANGAGLMTFDANWKLASIWQSAYVDKMLAYAASGFTSTFEEGTYPTPESPAFPRSSLGALKPLEKPGTCRSWCNSYTTGLYSCSMC